MFYLLLFLLAPMWHLQPQSFHRYYSYLSPLHSPTSTLLLNYKIFMGAESLTCLSSVLPCMHCLWVMSLDQGLT